jgi:pimeloyl-ACP methyl ester carboxylesterase
MKLISKIKYSVSRNIYFALFGILCFAFIGCGGGIGVKKIDATSAYRLGHQNAISNSSASVRTQMYMRRRVLNKSFKDDPIATLQQLDRKLCIEKDREMLFVLSELCFLEGKRSYQDQDTAMKLYLSSAVYAYAFLFDTEFDPTPSKYDPHYRLACDFYNWSLSELVEIIKKKNVFVHEKTLMPLLQGSLEINSAKGNLPWRPDEFDEIYSALDYKVKGLNNQSKTYGVGTPLILVRRSVGLPAQDTQTDYLPRLQQVFGATMILRLNQSICERTDADILLSSTVELVNPMITDDVVMVNTTVPIESDFTTPLAYMLDRGPKLKGIIGLLRAEAWKDRQGMFMLQPYQKGKIPVVFVHGLMSSPKTWLPMFNDLLNDKELREKYQFWFFMYPTGNPMVFSANSLRESILEIQRKYDPNGNEPYFNQMVIIGHSMGGIISRMMVINPGDNLWNALSDIPLDQMELEDQDRNLAKKIVFFKELPCVKRAVFICAPFRGSDYAKKNIGKIGSSLIKLPFTVLSPLQRVIPKILNTKDKETQEFLKSKLTGIKGLSPKNPLLQTLIKVPINSKVTYHSIIGNKKTADTPGGTDGIVTYDSAHLDGAASEKIVHSKHNAHTKAVTIAEILRILHLHLETTEVE